MGLRKYKLGDFIENSTANNRNLKYGIELIAGVSSEGVFTTPKGDPLDVDLKPYKIVRNGAFVYTPTRVNIGSIAYRTQGLCIVSHLYIVFYLNDKGKQVIDPYWLYMYLRRKEFGREVDFRLFGSARPEFSYRDMADIEIPLPSIEQQRKYVDVYLSLQNNLATYQSKVDDLKLVCDGYIEDLRRTYGKEAIGPYIRSVDVRNENLSVTLTQGVDVNMQFIPAKREAENQEGTKIVKTGQFAYNKVVKSNGTKLPIALREGPNCVISSSYEVFEVVNKEKLLPEYLMLWMSRSETHRQCGYKSYGTTRDVFPFEELCKLEFPIPSLEVQENVANIYKCYLERQRIAAQLKEQLNNLCPILIKGSLQN